MMAPIRARRFTDSELPLAVGHSDGTRKLVWQPEDHELRLEDTGNDPFETKPHVLNSGMDRYKVETAGLSRWFSVTGRRTAEEKVSAHDRDVLKSLGYAQ